MREVYRGDFEQAGGANPDSYVYMAMSAYMYFNSVSAQDAILFPTGVPKKAEDVRWIRQSLVRAAALNSLILGH
jgi:hypothetical protein